MADRGAAIYRYFRARGLSPPAAAGIVGNTRQESSNDPATSGGGLFQYQGGRGGGGRGGLRQQLDATWGELTGSERGTLNELRGARTPEQAALIFSKRFERPGVPMNANRQRYAADALQRYGGLPPGLPPAGAEGPAGTAGAPGALTASTTVSGGAPQLQQLLDAVKQMSGPEIVAAQAQPQRPSFAAGPTLPAGAKPIQPLTPKQQDPAKLQQLVEQAIGTPNVESKVTGGQLPEASPQGNAKLAGILAEANHISQAKVPYLWGGGHGGKTLPGGKVTPLDCSGAVSAALGINPKVSGQFEQWGSAGKGQHVTIYANAKHVLMEVDGKFWGTSSANPGGGAGWIKPGVISGGYLKGFTARHPAGL